MFFDKSIIYGFDMESRSLELERGQGLVDYALMLMLIGVAVIIILALFGNGVKELYEFILAALPL